MKRAIQDDNQVRALAQRMGAWPSIEDSIRRGHSGALIAGDWVFGYFTDGLVAFETDNPLEAVALAGKMMRHLGGPVSARFASPAAPAVH